MFVILADNLGGLEKVKVINKNNYNLMMRLPKMKCDAVFLLNKIFNIVFVKNPSQASWSVWYVLEWWNSPWRILAQQ